MRPTWPAFNGDADDRVRRDELAYAGPGQAPRTAIGTTSVINNLFGVASYTAGGTVDYFTRDENKALISQRRPSASAPSRRTYRSPTSSAPHAA